MSNILFLAKFADIYRTVTSVSVKNIFHACSSGGISCWRELWMTRMKKMVVLVIRHPELDLKGYINYKRLLLLTTQLQIYLDYFKVSTKE